MIVLIIIFTVVALIFLAKKMDEKYPNQSQDKVFHNSNLNPGISAMKSIPQKKIPIFKILFSILFVYILNDIFGWTLTPEEKIQRDREIAISREKDAIEKKSNEMEQKGREAVLSRLKYPESALFENLITRDIGGKTILCGNVNSKSDIGYNGFRKFLSDGNGSVDNTFFENAPEFPPMWNEFCATEETKIEIKETKKILSTESKNYKEIFIPRSKEDKGRYYLLESNKNGDIVSALHKRVGVDSVGYTKTETNCKTMQMREIGYSEESPSQIVENSSKWFELVSGSSKSDLADFVCKNRK
jgi:hypothetical protein